MRRLSIIIGSIAILALVLAGACAPAPTPKPALPVPTPKKPSPKPTPSPRPPEARGLEAASASVGTATWAAERMIVRTGTMSLKVKSVAKAADQVKEIADRLGGYVVSSTFHGREEERRATISIRVPAEKYDEATKELRGLAVEVISESTKAKDVTEEYVDLESKLRNLEATEEQYLTLMEKAKTVDEMLKIQRELSKVREDIEKTKGRMQYLERTSATSLIEIRLEQVKPLKAEFVADKIQVEVGEKVRFTNQTTGGFTPYGYKWDFGDKITSTKKNPTHTYDVAKTYTISLEVIDEKGNMNTETKADYITVISPLGWSAGGIAKSV